MAVDSNVKFNNKIIKRLVAVLSTGAALCLLISSCLLLAKIVPLYSDAEQLNFKIIQKCHVNSTEYPNLEPTTTTTTDAKVMNTNGTDGNKTISKILLNAEKVVEDALDVGDIIMRRKRDLKHGANYLITICLDEWSRFIGLGVAGIVLSLGHILTVNCVSCTTNPPEEERQNSTLPILMLIRLLLSNGLWLVLGLSLYSSHCSHGDFKMEQNFFSVFVAMEAAILSLFCYIKMNMTKLRRHYQYKLDGTEEEDIENCAASFQQLSELEVTDPHH